MAATTSLPPPYLSLLIPALTPFGMDDLPRLTTQTVIGITVAISGNVLISFALNLQKLAHKRLDKERNGEGQMTPPYYRRNVSDGPSLSEQDEDSDTITTEHTTPQHSDTTLESQPLLPVIDHSRNYTTLGDDESPQESQQTGFFRRIFRSGKHRDKKKRVTVLPINVMPEDAALHGLVSSRIKTNDEDDEETNEAAYLKSKLWYAPTWWINVPPLSTYLGGPVFS